MSLYVELRRRGQHDFFAKDLAPAVVASHLQQQLDEEQAHGSATTGQASAVKRLKDLHKRGKAVRTRLSDLIDNAWPHGTPERADFFVPGSSDPPLSAQLLAMAEGIGLHGLPGKAADQTEADVMGLGRALADAEDGRAKVGRSKVAASKTRGNLDVRTGEIATRLAKAVRGHYGRTSKELAAYGLTVQSAVRTSRRKKAEKALVPADEPKDEE